MKKELKSIVDGHHEYELTCEDQEVIYVTYSL